MIKIEVNNQRTMRITQLESGEINVKVGYKDEVDREYNISEGDFVSLTNYYLWQKEHGRELI